MMSIRSWVKESLVLHFLRSALNSIGNLASKLALGAEKNQVSFCGILWLILYDKRHRGFISLFFL